MRHLFLLFILAAVATPAAVVRIEFTAEIATVAGAPFGLDGSVRTQIVRGHFQYDTATPDTSDSPGRGEYLHEAFGDLRIELPSEIVVTGSATPRLQIEDLDPDTFRLQDGLSVLEPTIGAMSVNGVADEGLRFTFVITDSSGNAFSSDAAPVDFPFTPAMPHTFSLSHDGGTLLMQLVTLSVPDGPAVNVGGVVDAASFQQKLAPGSIASLFGARLGFVAASATALPLPNELAGVRVQVDGQDAGLIFVAPGQINFQVPFEAATGGPLTVTVVRNGLASGGEAVAAAVNAPGVFVNPNDGHPIVTKHPDGSLATPENPARPGDVLIVFVTGLEISKTSQQAALRPALTRCHLHEQRPW